MSNIPILRRRLDDVDAVLRSVRKLERQDRTSQRGTPGSARAIASIRAGTYVMIYNAVEAAIRGSMGALRAQIQQEAVIFSDAKDFWQLDFIQAEFLEKMQSGTNHGNVLTGFASIINAPLRWEPTKLTRLPSSGNFGQHSAISLKNSLPLNWSAPAGSGGGIDLETIRVRRNELAHGLEEYEVVGSSTTTLDMFGVVDRIRLYVTSFVQAIERYQFDRFYLR